MMMHRTLIRRFALMLCLLLAVSATGLAAAYTPADAAQDLFDWMLEGEYAAVRSKMNKTVRALYSEQELADTMKELQRTVGDYVETISATQRTANGDTEVRLTTMHEDANLLTVFVFRSDGALSQLAFFPGESRPSEEGDGWAGLLSKILIGQLSSGNYEAAHNQFDETMQAQVPPETLKEAWTTMAAAIGPFQRIGEIEETEFGDLTTAEATLHHEDGEQQLTITYAADQKVAGLHFTAGRVDITFPSEVPDDAAEAAEEEEIAEETEAADEGWAVPAAKDLIDALAASDYEAVFDQLDDVMRAQVPLDALETAWADLVASIGPFEAFGDTEETEQDDLILVRMALLHETGAQHATVAFDADRKVAGLLFAPETPAPTEAAEPTPSPVPNDIITDDPAIETAKQLIDQLAAGDYEAVFGQFDSTMRAQVPVDTLETIWEALVASIGPFEAFGDMEETEQDDLTLVQMTLQHEDGKQQATVALDAEQKIAGLLFASEEAPVPAPTETAKATPSPAPDDAHKAADDSDEDDEWAIPLAQNVIELLADSDYEAAFDQFDGVMQAQVPLETLQSTWESLVASIGPFESFGDAEQTEEGDLTIVQLVLNHESGARQQATFTLSEDKQITGLLMMLDQGEEADPLPLPDGATEEEVTLRPGKEDETGGTLTLPEGDGPFPAVIMMQGSGASDRDEAVMGVRPFRDIAVGLAAQGVASLRYDKYSYAHPELMAEDMTIDREYGLDRHDALALLLADDRIGDIYLLGHSEGGMLVPRMLLESGDSVSGGIIMAGTPRSLWEIQQMQNEDVLAGLSGDVLAQSQALVDAEVEKGERLADMTDEELKTETIFGIPASYHLDLMTPDPLETARYLELPLLIQQGEKDFQVKADADYVLWEKWLEDMENVTFKLYPDLTHLFIKLEGESTGTIADYAAGGHVEDEVISDIAEWILAQ